MGGASSSCCSQRVTLSNVRFPVKPLAPASASPHCSELLQAQNAEVVGCLSSGPRVVRTFHRDPARLWVAPHARLVVSLS